MSFMSVSQYAKHAGMSRQALYTWEAKQGFPARVNGKIDQAACDAYLRQFRDSHDPRMKNAVGKLNTGVHGFEASCFDGVYVTGITPEGISQVN